MTETVILSVKYWHKNVVYMLSNCITEPIDASITVHFALVIMGKSKQINKEKGQLINKVTWVGLREWVKMVRGAKLGCILLIHSG